ncbi:MAG: acyl-CoA/acyl-ACP dehydrogenase [Planctomycetes bacterium]|nr:acyl-CoA/acyl-ACP dehydrogenase [Planctomycetota bacterium]
MPTNLAELTRALRQSATRYDRDDAWPDDSIAALTAAGAWEWVIPTAFGGKGLDPITHLHAYEAIAAGCFATLLILSNRDGACELIAAGENDALKTELLRKLARHEIMTSIGISQLTTSHQSGPPALTATIKGDQIRLTGFMPWVTSAEKCQYIVTGAVTSEGQQVLAAVPTNLPGMTIGKPFDLAVMKGTHTTDIRCDGVLVERRFILRGPAEKVLATRSGVKPALVAAAGIGLAGTMLSVAESAAAHSRLAESIATLRQRHTALRTKIYDFVASPEALTADKTKAAIRVDVNELLAQLSIAVLAACKGTGLQRDHDAQRLLREAMFYQVWAAPEDVRVNTLQRFAS